MQRGFHGVAESAGRHVRSTFRVRACRVDHSDLMVRVHVTRRCGSRFRCLEQIADAGFLNLTGRQHIKHVLIREFTKPAHAIFRRITRSVSNVDAGHSCERRTIDRRMRANQCRTRE